jgi:DNA/RNA-binding domain of Phe-tRNA-synthetase-like protein
MERGPRFTINMTDEHSADMQSLLSKATIDPAVFRIRPDYRALLIVAANITPSPSDSSSEARLVKAESTAKALLATKPVTELPHIAAWREAYKTFGAKPNKTRNSLEALTRRVDKGLPRINRLTDIYNAICVKHQIPLGGEDLDKYSGPPQLKVATGEEIFETTEKGEQVVEKPPKGEVVWCDDVGVTCRVWNWRQGPRTALTDDTKNALFILDTLEPCSDDDVKAAGEELVAALREYCPNLSIASRLLSSSSQ